MDQLSAAVQGTTITDSTAADTPTSWEESLSNWYRDASQQSIKLDLIGDLVGRELFAIHGDSLLLHCITQAQVDFDNGPQVLHAVHAVESFLQKLNDHACHYHIIWFESDDLWARRKNGAKYLLVRAIVMEHLNRQEAIQHSGTRSAFSFTFPHFTSAEFDQYLLENAVRSFMIHNGDQGSLGYTELIWQASRRRYAVALINQLETVGSKMSTFVMSPSSTVLELTQGQAGSQIAPSPSEGSTGATIRRALDACSKQQDGPVSAREVVTLACLNEMLTADASQASTTKELCVALLYQLAILRSFPLSSRSSQLSGSDEKKSAHKKASQFLAEFASHARSLITGWSNNDSVSETKWDLFDLVDGRIFHEVHQNLARKGFASGHFKEAADLFEMVEDLTGVDLSSYSKGRHTSSEDSLDTPTSTSTPDSRQSQDGHARVLAFSHPVLDPHLQDVKLTTDNTPEPVLPTRISQEVTYWQNSKKPVDSKFVLAKKPNFWAAKRNQKFMADTIAYSASLTNAAGKNIEPEIIIAGKSKSSKEDKSINLDWKAAQVAASKRQNEKAKEKKPAKKSNKEKALDAARERQEQKIQEKSGAVAKFWAERRKGFEAEKDLVKRYLDVMKYVGGLSATDLAVVESEVLLYSCSVLVQLVAANKDTTGLDISAMMWRKVVDLATMKHSPEVHLGLEKFLKFLKLPSDILSAPEKAKEARKVVPTKLPSVLDTLDLIKDPHEFQTKYCGPYLDRDFDSQPDPRVPFSPDAWQRRVLDSIDADRSLFVVAPTSAGKTFISFYAMKKILQSNDNDVIVYVAPTKALVNQIAAEIQARFTKSYEYEGHSVWAIHTRDYRVNNSTGCQVLVTVPDILQIMLLAPSNAEKPNSWSNRVKRIIFDEVHVIGQAEDGLIWEQLLLLAPCPIIALSATVGNPQDFYDWMKGTQEAKGYQMDMVVHESRYSDLRKFLYVPPTSEEFQGLERYNGLPLPGLDQGAQNSRLRLVHPICSVVDPNRDTLADINLEARDCYTLWQCMNKHQTSKFPLDKALDPRKFLPAVLKKKHIVSWESALKAQLQKWMRNPESPFQTIRAQLRQDIAEVPTKVDLPAGEERFAPTLNLLNDLARRGALPAIIFNFDRTECEEIATQLLDKLTAAESQWKETSKEWKKTMTQYGEWKKAAEAAAAKGLKAPAKEKKGKGSKEDGMSKAEASRESASKEFSKWETFDPEAPLEKFSFANDMKLPKDDMDTYLWKLNRAGVSPKLIDAFKRGVGVHHAGMNREYRQAIEILFRRGFLTVVISTGTLALGINMPCKTVCFTGDWLHLNALNFRQAAGRAGRRGFDTLGNIVFYQISPDRVLEIMSSTLPDLRGQFPVSTTLVLRLLSLLHNTKNSEYAVRAVNSLLSQTRCYLGGPPADMSIKHHVRFSIEYLRRQHLLSANGTPLNFSGLVGHLYFTGNAVFAFHSILKNGYFQDLCNDIDTRPKQIMQDIVLVLCHIFGRIPLPQYKNPQWLERVHRSSSQVILEPLPPAALKILKQHNKETLQIFKNYVETYVDQHLANEPDCELPFTKIKVGSEQTTKSLGQDVFTPLLATRIRSPFAALSGFSDDFSSIHELCSTARGGIFLEESAVPSISTYPDETGGVPWNAYFLDFFKHGDMATLVRDNDIKPGDVWYVLKDFSLILGTIITSLENFIAASPIGDDAAMADVQDVGDRREEEKVIMDEPVKAEPIKPQEVAKALMNISSGRKIQAKTKKVAEDWLTEANEQVLRETDPFTPVTPVYPESASECATPPNGDSDPATASPHGTDPPMSPTREKPLEKVLRAFKMVQEEFEEKFRSQFA